MRVVVVTGLDDDQRNAYLKEAALALKGLPLGLLLEHESRVSALREWMPACLVYGHLDPRSSDALAKRVLERHLSLGPRAKDHPLFLVIDDNLEAVKSFFHILIRADAYHLHAVIALRRRGLPSFFRNYPVVHVDSDKTTSRPDVCAQKLCCQEVWRVNRSVV